MIQLTRLNNQPIVVNSDMIKFVESAHDTVLTLMNGEKIIVREHTDEIIARVIEFRRAVLAGMPVSNSSAPSSQSANKLRSNAASSHTE